MTAALAFLQENERQALTDYISRLLARASQHVQQVILFGSKARGDAGADSDLDLLVIVDRYDADTDRLVTTTASRVSFEHNTLINTHIVTLERWAEMQKWSATLWRAVQADGVPLLPERVSA
ncbi:MAG TPA: nucleotidyltransferase domain-containing protein [Anaerolineae bacterium]|nr:nucleotidyltransferase domain-containing protein [Anaerolineae bacterium]